MLAYVTETFWWIKFCDGKRPCTDHFTYYLLLGCLPQLTPLTRFSAFAFHETGASTKKWIRLWSFCSFLHGTFHWRGPWKAEEGWLGNGISFHSSVLRVDFHISSIFSSILFSPFSGSSFSFSQCVHFGHCYSISVRKAMVQTRGGFQFEKKN